MLTDRDVAWLSLTVCENCERADKYAVACC